MRIAHFFTCDNQAFSYTSHFLLLCIVSFFLNEWVGSDELRSKKCDQQQTNNNITSSLIIRWPSCNTMLQYSRNAINVYMFFIIIAISFYWYGNSFSLHWIRLTKIIWKYNIHEKNLDLIIKEILKIANKDTVYHP